MIRKEENSTLQDDEFSFNRLSEIASLLVLDKDEHSKLRDCLHYAYKEIREKIQHMMADKLGETTENRKLAEETLADILKMFPNWHLEQTYSSFHLYDEDHWDVSGWMNFKYEYSTVNWKKIGKPKIEVDWKKFAHYAEKTDNKKLRAYLVAKKMGTNEK